MDITSLEHRLALAALVNGISLPAVDRALQDSGCVAGRVRALPPWVTMYHVLISAMTPSATYDDVTRLLWAMLPAATGRQVAQQLPTRGAVTRARARLGVEPFERLLESSLTTTQLASERAGIYLARFEHRPGASLWWACDAGTGRLKGCDLRGEETAAAVALVDRVSAHHVVVHSPSRDPMLHERLRSRGRVTTTSLLPESLGLRWAWGTLRSRTSEGWHQDALAYACVQVALDLALAPRPSGQRPIPT